jgi:hypothetical protein
VFDLSVASVTISSTTIENDVFLPLWLLLDRGAGDCPDLIVLDSVYYTHFEKSQTSLKRYASAEDAQAGIVSMKYKTADVISDTTGSGIPASHGYFLNTNYIKLVVHEDADLDEMEKKEPVNQDGEVIPILWMGNMTTYQTVLSAVGGNIPRPIAIAMSANGAAAYGWYQISGVATAKKTCTISLAAGAAVAVLTTGLIAGTGSGKEIQGAVVAAVASATAGRTTVSVMLSRPTKQGRIT